MVAPITLAILAAHSQNARNLADAGFRSIVAVKLPSSASGHRVVLSDDGEAAFFFQDNEQMLALARSGSRLGSVNSPAISIIAQQPDFAEPALVPRPAVGNGYLHPYVIAATGPYAWYVEHDSYDMHPGGHVEPTISRSGVGFLPNARAAPMLYTRLADPAPGLTLIGRFARVEHGTLAVFRTGTRAGRNRIYLITFDWRRKRSSARLLATFGAEVVRVDDADINGRAIVTVRVTAQYHPLELRYHGRKWRLPYGCWLWRGRVLAARPDGVYQFRSGKLKPWLRGWDWVGTSASNRWVALRRQSDHRMYECRSP